jgi:hypothetical protein
VNQGANQVAVPKPASSSVVDPELAALPAPPRREKILAVSLMLFTALASAAMAWTLRSEVAYAFSAAVPADIGELTTVQVSSLQPGAYVEARGLLGTYGAVRYSRPLEGDSFRLQPVAGNPKIWVEIRIPEGLEGPRFIPPTSFAGRLAPLKQAGLRHSGLSSSVRSQTSVEVPGDAWLLVDGASPRASRWAVALFSLFVFFAFWNLATTARVLRRVGDG